LLGNVTTGLIELVQCSKLQNFFIRVFLGIFETTPARISSLTRVFRIHQAVAMMALAPLHRKYTLTRVIVSSYQATR
jgi:hypothetical protein